MSESSRGRGRPGGAAAEERPEEVRDYPEAEERRAGSFTELFGSLVDEVRTLLRQEVALARAESSEKVASVGNSLATMVVGGAIVLAAALVLLSALNRGLTVLLAQLMSAEIAIWLAPAILFVVFGLIGWGLISAGRRRISKIHLKPDQTVESLREDREWVKEKMRHG